MYKLHPSYGHISPFLDIASSYEGARKEKDKVAKNKRCVPDESVNILSGKHSFSESPTQ